MQNRHQDDQARQLSAVLRLAQLACKGSVTFLSGLIIVL